MFKDDVKFAARFKTVTTKIEKSSIGVSGIYKKIHKDGVDVDVFVRKNTEVNISAFNATKALVIDVDGWAKAETVDELPESTIYSGDVIMFRGDRIHLTVVDTIDNFRKVMIKLSGKSK